MAWWILCHVFFLDGGDNGKALECVFYLIQYYLVLLPNIGSIATGWMRLMEQALVLKKVFEILSYVAAALL